MATPFPVDSKTINPPRHNGSGAKSGVSSLQDLSRDGTDDSLRLDLRRFRPLGVSDMFDEAFDLYKNNFRLMLFSTALVYIPLYIIMVVFFNPLAKQVSQLAALSDPSPDVLLDAFQKSLLDSTVASLIYGFAMILTTGAVSYIASQRYLNRPVGMGEAYSIAGRRLWVLCLSAIGAMIFSSPFALLCGLGLLIPTCRFAILPQVAVLENQGIIASIKRTWRMSGPAFGRIATVLTMLTVINFIFTEALTAPLDLIQQFAVKYAIPLLSTMTIPVMAVANMVIGAAVGLVTAPFGTAVMTIAYYDTRIRDEGFDMAILTEKLGHGTAEAIAWVPNNVQPAKVKAAKKR